MDILQFVNSKDIRNHLKEIDYQFNTLEAAWLIYQSRNHTLYERLDAFEELMHCFPDCEVKEGIHTVAQDSLFEYLKLYIEKNKSLIEEFTNSDGFYMITIFRSLETNFYTLNKLFNTLESAIEQCKLEYDKYYEPKKYEISKVFATDKASDDFVKPYSITIRPSDLEIMDADYSSNDANKYKIINDVFDGLWFDFPTPFKVGDIVYDVTRNDKPFVLNKVGFSEREKQFFENRENYGDSSDMTYDAYFPMRNGTFGEVDWDYMNLEYFTDELENYEKLLKPISCFLKGEIDIGLCCNALTALQKQQEAKRVIPNEYTDEILKELGVME